MSAGPLPDGLNRMVNLVLDLRHEDRRNLDTATIELIKARERITSLEESLKHQDLQVLQYQQALQELHAVIDMRDRDLKIVQTAQLAAETELVPLQVQVNALERRIAAMAPQRRFKVVSKVPGFKTRTLPLLGVSSANGVTTITVNA